MSSYSPSSKMSNTGVLTMKDFRTRCLDAMTLKERERREVTENHLLIIARVALVHEVRPTRSYHRMCFKRIAPND